MLQHYTLPGLQIAGCDEAGRGCLAGPVFAAAVILPEDYSHEFLNDSKQLSHKIRMRLRQEIMDSAIAWAVASIDNNDIDKINILNASILGMHKALDKLICKPDHIIVDGNRFKPYKSVPHTCIVKGDSKFLAIAAASILAKTFRDEFMENLHKDFPQYAWDRNKGYPTKEHRIAISKHGITSYHRKSFRLLNEQLEIQF